MTEILSWLFSNYIEIIGTITSLIYLYFSVKKNILCWLFGIISSGIYVFVFLKSGFYADMGLNVYYFFISIYGWIIWSGGISTNNKKAKLPVSRLNFKLAILILSAILVLFLLLSYLLVQYTDSQIPYWDAFTTAGSIVATWMLARKIIEHWVIWIIVDLVSMGLYIYKDLHTTSILFLIYTVIAVIGYIQWKKDLK